MPMFDFAFDWRKELETGIETIDRQHKRLFEIGRDVEQLIRIECIGVTDKQLLDIVCEFREFVGYHFYEEEIIMEMAGVKQLEEHRRQHEKFRKVVEEFNIPELKKTPVKNLKKIKNIMQDAIFNHMLTSDISMTKEVMEHYRFLKEYIEQ